MADVTVVGRGTRIRGRVTGAVDIEIQGFVDGEVSVLGDVTVDTHGLVAASIRGRRVTVRGAVRGDLTGEDAIVLEDGARVVGDVRAPRVAIAPGALVKGYVQTGGVEAAPQPRARAQEVVRAAPAVRAAIAKPAAPKPAARPAPPPSAPALARVVAPPSALAGVPISQTPKRPPPPVVPALKKGAKGAMKKKA